MVRGLSASQYVQRALQCYHNPGKLSVTTPSCPYYLSTPSFDRIKADYTLDKWPLLMGLPYMARMESIR